MFRVAFLIGVLCVGFLNSSHASEELYAAQCAACHAADAQGNSVLNAPALAGQSAAYLERQLKNFKSGTRGSAQGDITGAQMRAIAMSVQEADMQSLAAYLAGLPAAATEGASDDMELLKAGEKLYQSYCGSCHGSDASGYEALNAPNLKMLSRDYLTLQYTKFLSGQRGTEPNDRFGRQMAMMAKAVSEEEQINAIVSYIDSLQ